MQRSAKRKSQRRGTVLLMIVGLLAMLFMIVSAYIVLARFDRQTLSMASQAEQVRKILKAIEDVLVAEISGDSPADLVTGENYAETWGYYDTTNPQTPIALGQRWLSAPELVHDPNSITYSPLDFRIVADTSLSRPPAGPARNGLLTLADLAIDTDRNADPSDLFAVLNGSPGLLTSDTRITTLLAFMDADGDGIPDGHFADNALLTELANAMVGRGVRAQGIDPARFYDSSDPNWADANYSAWLQFENQARYIVSSKVVSHGGMVQMSLPYDPNNVPWNATYTGNLLYALMSPRDSQSNRLLPGANLEDRITLYDLYTNRATVEPYLRRRGGLLAPARANQVTGMPPALYDLQEKLYYTLVPQDPNGPDPTPRWQRYNLADQGDWVDWLNARSIDPDAYVAAWPSNAYQVPATYASRQFLTTVNNSDELARIQEVRDPNNPIDPNDPSASPLDYLWPGDLKFSLQRLATAFNPNNAEYDPSVGQPLIKELAAYYDDMLSGHSWDPNDTILDDRSQQALMLAVNTLAFAAPRRQSPSPERGWFDNVYYYDPDTTRTYVGYVPQPFITQVLAYVDAADPNDIAVAVELYNPNDRADVGGNDVHALVPSQYALTIDTNSSSNAIANGLITPGNFANLAANLPPSGKFPGRRFLTLFFNDGASNSVFESAIGPLIPLNSSQIVSFDPTSDELKVRLWRIGSDSTVALIDEFEVSNPDTLISHPSGWEGAYVDAYRDLSSEPYWGRDSTLYQARWRCVASVPVSDGSNYKSTAVADGRPDQEAVKHLQSWNEPNIEVVDGDPSIVDGVRFAPTVPLYTMNSDLSTVLTEKRPFIHGSYRPASFPTVGFLHFVPRYAHTMIPGATGAPEYRPMGTYLYKEWTRLHSGNVLPADFGHMPIFDNSQNAPTSGPFARTDPIPWGLLVYDYFTTFDYTAGDFDPYRVPGRININTAPWYLLAQIPLLGPDNWGALPTADLPLPSSSSPAFWSASSGIMVGLDSLGFPRFPQIGLTGLVQIHPSDPSEGGQWYRLGPHFGQAIAAYRDRVGYVKNTTSPFAEAHWRNNAAGLEYRPLTPVSYDAIRGSSDVLTDPNQPDWKRGFLSVGELANVMGMDGTLDYNAIQPGNYVLATGDFMKAACLLAMIDSQFLTTRSNTFTIYTTLTDRETPSASVRTQVTVDRSNLLPRNLRSVGLPHVLVDTGGEPELIGKREVSYFNAQFDE